MTASLAFLQRAQCCPGARRSVGACAVRLPVSCDRVGKRQGPALCHQGGRLRAAGAELSRTAWICPPTRSSTRTACSSSSSTQPISMPLPDIAVALPDYVTIARVDPDRKGIRIGLRGTFNLNSHGSGRKAVHRPAAAELAGPAAGAAARGGRRTGRARQEGGGARRAAAQGRGGQGRSSRWRRVRVGRNPTFLRLQFDWNVDTEAKFALKGNERPHRVRLAGADRSLRAQGRLCPRSSRAPSNPVSAAGSRVGFKRRRRRSCRASIELSPRQFVVDIDIAPDEGLKAALAAEEAAKQAPQAAKVAARGASSAAPPGSQARRPGRCRRRRSAAPGGADADGLERRQHRARRRSRSTRTPPPRSSAAATPCGWCSTRNARSSCAGHVRRAAAIASDFEVMPAGDTKVVRLDLAADRLATLGSEGRSWVLSLGRCAAQRHRADDAQPRSATTRAGSEMTADLERPGQVHVLRDPVVGDTLRVVTVMPPARGVAPQPEFVDFEALRSAHGLVLKPRNDEPRCQHRGPEARSSQAAGGLTLSALDRRRAPSTRQRLRVPRQLSRPGVWREDDPVKFMERARGADRTSRSGRRAAARRGAARSGAVLCRQPVCPTRRSACSRCSTTSWRATDLRKKLRLTRSHSRHPCRPAARMRWRSSTRAPSPRKPTP